MKLSLISTLTIIIVVIVATLGYLSVRTDKNILLEKKLDSIDKTSLSEKDAFIRLKKNKEIQIKRIQVKDKDINYHMAKLEKSGLELTFDSSGENLLEIEGNYKDLDKFYYEISKIKSLCKLSIKMNDGQDIQEFLKVRTEFEKLFPEGVVLSLFHCFLKGTKVKTSSGYKNIEDLKINDLVWSRDLEAELNNLCNVLNLFKYKSKGYYIVSCGDDNISVTSEHPFYDSSLRKFIPAKELKIGSTLLKFDGTAIKVRKLEYVIKSVDVYNISVDMLHNYFVGTTGVLVHNKR